MSGKVPAPLRIKLSDERRAALVHSIRAYWLDELDEEITDFRADRLLDFFVHELGPAVYNQAIQDARAFITGKLDDLEGELYEPD